MKYLFSPHEIFFCGRSGSGKTFLLRRMTRLLRERHFSVGYVKHDAHRFEMDHPGKDTHTLWNAGASSVSISDSDHSAFIVRGAFSQSETGIIHQSADVVLVEGYKSLPGRKIVLLHPDDDWESVRHLENVVAVVGARAEKPNIYPEVPYFHRDDVEGIASFVVAEIAAMLQKTPLFGLILAGGRSQRMKRDKAWLGYGGRPQIARIYAEMEEVCAKVFVSCRPEQWDFSEDSEERRFIDQAMILHDRLVGFGPLGGILSAMLTYPEAAFFVAAVDMPFIRREDVRALLGARNPAKAGTCFINPENELVEPLCAIYEPKARWPLLEALGRGFLCPRKIVAGLDVIKVSPLDPMTVANINHPAEYESAQRSLAMSEVVDA